MKKTKPNKKINKKHALLVILGGIGLYYLVIIYPALRAAKS